MNLIQLGSGRPVVLLHGSPTPTSDLLPIAERLADEHHVLIPELPGYGQSPEQDDVSFARIGDQLAELLAANTSGPPRALVGFSSGAYRALDLALQRNVVPDVIIGLGALATLGDEERIAFRAFASSLRADPTGAAIRPILPGRWLSDAWRKMHHHDEARVTSWLDSTSAHNLAAELDAEAQMRDLRPLLPALACELVLRVGEVDLATPPTLSHEIASLAPRAHVEVVPGCGHALLIEDRAANDRARRGDRSRPTGNRRSSS